MAASVLRDVREVTPRRGLSPIEAAWLAERQAKRLLDLFEITEPPVPDLVFETLPRIQVRYVDDIPQEGGVAGAAAWIGGHWVMLINDGQASTRKRWTTCHELKHVLDHPFIDYLYPETKTMDSSRRKERAADGFAAALLIPRMWLKRDYFDAGIQDHRTLTKRYGVSGEAMNIRLRELGVIPQPLKRCAA